MVGWKVAVGSRQQAVGIVPAAAWRGRVGVRGRGRGRVYLQQLGEEGLPLRVGLDVGHGD